MFAVKLSKMNIQQSVYSMECNYTIESIQIKHSNTNVGDFEYSSFYVSLWNISISSITILIELNLKHD